MNVVFHPEFPRDQIRFQADYGELSAGLAERFRGEIDEAIAAIKPSPSAAGHFVNTGSLIVPEPRRRNLNAFPFFILYGYTGELPVFGSIIPTKPDPLNWLARFPER